MGTRCADHVTPLYPQKLALTSPTGGGRSVGIVRVQTKGTEFDAYRETDHHETFYNATSTVTGLSNRQTRQGNVRITLQCEALTQSLL